MTALIPRTAAVVVGALATLLLVASSGLAADPIAIIKQEHVTNGSLDHDLHLYGAPPRPGETRIRD